jgi:DNA-directed RNA polymerase specialized sigma24 family protein
MGPDEYFATEWPALVPKLRGMLARAGAPAADREDLVQETALRLYRMWSDIDQERGVEPLARRIATNAWRDQWRRRGERELLGDVPDAPASHDTERAALARVEVGEVSRALSRLRPGVADVLRMAATEFEGATSADGGTPAALRMARSRARRALAASMRVACGFAVFVFTAARAFGRPARTAVATGAVATVALVLTLSTHAAPKQAPQRVAVWPATVVASATAPAPAATHIAARSVATRGGHAAAGHRKARHASNEPPYYTVHAGPSTVGAWMDFYASPYGVRVQSPAATQVAPVCGYGDTPDSAVTPRCPAP